MIQARSFNEGKSWVVSSVRTVNGNRMRRAILLPGPREEAIEKALPILKAWA